MLTLEQTKKASIIIQNAENELKGIGIKQPFLSLVGATHNNRKEAEILKTICRELGFDDYAYYKKCREPEYVELRCICFLILRNYCMVSLTHAAKVFNYNDHTSVWHIKNKAKDLLTKNKLFQDKYTECERAVLKLISKKK